ncbi:MAG: S8 family serine peptidase [Phycisphaerales bacterium]
MHFRLLLSAGLLLSLVSSVAANPPTGDIQIGNDADVDTSNQRFGLADRAWLLPKPQVSVRPTPDARLIVKFTDASKMRPVGGSATPLGGPNPAMLGQLSALEAVVTEFGITFEPWFEQSFEALREVERKAEFNSGRAQPDLAGMMFVVGPNDRLEAIADALNTLDIVEGAAFVPKPVNHGGESFATAAAVPAPLAAGALGPGGGGGVPNFTADANWHRFYTDLNGNGQFDVPPFTPFFLAPEFEGGIDTEYAWNEVPRILKDNNLYASTWKPTDNPGRGATVRIGVMEGGAAVDPFYGVHVDLVDVILEPGQRLMPEEVEGMDHGSATLGIIGAKDHGLPGPDLNVPGDNAEIGIIGLVPDAEVWFFPTVSITQPAGRLQSAIISATQHFERGDVLSMSIGFPPGPLATNPFVSLLLRIAADIGIMPVMSAGNACFNHDDLEIFDTGGTIVGAGQPILGARPDLAPYTRHGFSNHMTESGNVHVQAWGAGVFTCGYGDAFDIDGQLEFRYAADFGGTSAACPMVAGTCAALQAIAKAVFGIPLMPEQIGSVVRSGIRQEGIPPFLVSGTEDPPDGHPCLPATYIQGPDEPDPDLIGNFPYWLTNFQSLLTTPWFDPSVVFDVVVLRGKRLFGNTNSLKAADNNPLIVQSRFGSIGTFDGFDPFPSPTYFLRGHMTDIGVRGFAANPGFFGGAIVTLRLKLEAMQASPIIGFEVFNVQNQKWDWVGMDLNGATTYHDQRMLPNPAFGIGASSVDQNGFIHVRCWVYALGFNNGRFTTLYDWVNMTLVGTSGGGLGTP